MAEWRKSAGGRYRSQHGVPAGERSSELEYQCHLDDHLGAKDTGNPLSVIPKYTINNSLDWTITQAFSASVNWTLYGRQKPRTHAETRSEDTGGLSGKELGAYSLVGTNFNYDINKNLRLNVGVSNIFDKQIYRSSEGANTYNEPGRAYYAGVTASF